MARAMYRFLLLSILTFISVSLVGSQKGYYRSYSQSPDIWKVLGDKDVYCVVNKRHTVCRYRRINELGLCRKIVKRGLSSYEKIQLVDAHNQKRKEIAKGLKSPHPSASNMVKLTWNEEASAIAQLWADQCKYEHDKIRDTVKPKLVKNGQNIYMMMTTSSSSQIDVGKAVDEWFNEIKDYPANGVDSLQKTKKVTGHYTQVVWAETTQVGCGYIQHHKKQGGRLWHRHILVCNYAPTGNTFMNGKGQPLYKQGTSCSACPPEFPKCEDGLCTK